ncbi:hypothetical protein FACS1894133_7030 [Clostridia bacterium]|nr:hypothetical protein FACS1894133_7030 [Clostridia bacterium]
MVTTQVNIDDATLTAADALFSRLGFDTPTAVGMFITASLERGDIPFTEARRSRGSKARGSGFLAAEATAPLDDEIEYDDLVYYRKPNAELRATMEDVRLRRNLIGPFDTVEEAMKSLLED